MSSPIADIGNYLEYKGLGIFSNDYTAGTHNIFMGKVRPKSEYIPVDSIFVALIPSNQKPEKEFSHTYRIRSILVQVIVRGSKNSLEDTYAKAKDIFDVLDYPMLTETFSEYMKVEPISDINWAGYDDNDFPLYTITIEMKREESY